jgi:hypothetical protein
MKLFSLAILLLVLGSCAKGVSSSKSAGETAINSYEENLKAVRPKVVWAQPETKEEVVLEKTAFKLDAPQNENIKIKKALGEIVVYNANIGQMPGYRLQIYSGNDRYGYESAKSYVLQHFPELEIYESYSQPTYRVKVGDFLKKMDAERYYALLMDRFSSSKIIMDDVEVQKSLKIN